MMVSYDWYTTNYQHAVAYATFVLKATVYNKPFMFNIGLKKSVDFIFLIYFFNFQDNFIISGMPGQSIKVRDCPGQSRTYCMYDIIPQK